MADSKRFTLARKEKQNADLIRKQNEARIFLTSVLNEDIEEEDMSVALQDGVLLCKLINRFKPDSIKKFNANPRIPFKMMENAAFVLDFCKKNSIPVTFTAENICNKEHVILILGFILTIAERMGFVPPPIDSSTHDATPPPRGASPAPRGASPAFHAQEGAISPRAATAPANPFRNSPTSSSPAAAARSKPSPAAHSSSPSGNPANSVRSVVDELIASERDFLQDMDIFMKLIVHPSKGLLPGDKMNAIFGNIENVLAANNKFLSDLVSAQEGFNSISTVWSNFSSAINIYSVYCIFQQNSYGALEQCRKQFPNFDAHLRSVEYTPESRNGNTFNFLLKPFSRVMKYNSVLKQLLQCVTAGTEDHDILADLKKQFQDLSDTTSDTWKKVENSRKIAEITGKLMGAEKVGLRKLGRIYLREGDFVLNAKPVKLYLFSDIIVYAVPVKAILGGKKSGGKSHIFKGIIALNTASFQDLPDGKEGKNLIELTTSEKVYKIQAPSASDKRLWVTDISKCISKLNTHSRDLPSNPSPLEPRPQLDIGRRPVPARLDSQNHVLVEERRKTVKLAFGSQRNGNDDEDEEEEDKQLVVEEVENVQLELKHGGAALTEEDKRKTIKLEFGAPQQRQLSIRDRSKTVELTFKKESKDENDEADQDEEAPQIVDRRKTVKLAFKSDSPPPQSDSSSEVLSDSSLDNSGSIGIMRESGESFEHERGENEVEDSEAQNQDTLSADVRYEDQDNQDDHDNQDSQNNHDDFENQDTQDAHDVQDTQDEDAQDVQDTQDTHHNSDIQDTRDNRDNNDNQDNQDNHYTQESQDHQDYYESHDGGERGLPRVDYKAVSANQQDSGVVEHGESGIAEGAQREVEESPIDQEEAHEHKEAHQEVPVDYQAEVKAETQSGTQAESLDVQVEVPVPPDSQEQDKFEDLLDNQASTQEETKVAVQVSNESHGELPAPFVDETEVPKPALETKAIVQGTTEYQAHQVSGSVDLDDSAAFGIVSQSPRERSQAGLSASIEIASLQQEITDLKGELRTTQEKLQQLMQEQLIEREENKAWKTRVERILLDVMKQKEK